MARGRLQGRADVLRMLEAGREERRRADDEAAAHRDRLDVRAADRRAALLAEVAELEHRRAELAAEVERMAGTVPHRTDGPPATGRLRDRLRRVRSPRAGTA
ncbi:hypothetical protein E9529_09335 [Blastococcus sp. KM273128]|nr:hypothetical protein [Blastococcus sp. KM273128]